MNIVICDDVLREGEETAAFLRRYYVQKNLSLPNIVQVQTSRELWAQQQIDILFLDIELGEESGIAVAAEMNRISPGTMIVFVSSYPSYVTETYTVKVAQFFVKPLQETVFFQQFERILNKYQSSQESFIRKAGGEEMVLCKKSILYIESRKRVLIVYLVDGEQRQYYGKIGEEEAFFKGSSIIRCHRGFLVNLEYVYGMHTDQIILQLPDKSLCSVPVGDTWRGEVQAKLLQYLNQS